MPRRYVLLITSLASFLTPFMSSAVNIALPAIGTRFSAGAIGLGWVATAYTLAAAVLLVPLGRVADLRGRELVFTIGIGIDAVASLGCAFAPGLGWLIALRALQGAGGAMIFGTATAMLSAAYPPQKRGRVLGINVAAVYSGLSLGPLLGGVLTQHLGWRGVFYSYVLLSATTLVLALVGLKPRLQPRPETRFDFPGSLIYAAGLVSLMYGLPQLPALRGWILVIAGLVALLGFVRWELTARNPVLDIHLFRGNRAFGFSNLAALINYSATAAIGFLLSLYLQHGRRLTPETAGLVLVAQPVMQALFSPLAGRLSDRVQPRVIASLGMALTVLGLTRFALITFDAPFWSIVLALALLGFAFALFSSPNVNAIMGSVEQSSYGVASGVLATMRLIGQMLSMGISLMVFSVFVGNQQISADTYHQFLPATRVAFAVFALLCLLGVFASLARGHHREQVGTTV
jgi:EmrB/QacA subfamily drug resistance transporter